MRAKNTMDLKDCSWSIENTPALVARSLFYYVQSTGHFMCRKSYLTDREGYNSILLLYTLSGKGHLKYMKKDYTLSANDAFLIDCMNYQYYGCHQDGQWEMVWLHFNGGESRGYAEEILKENGPVFTFKSIDNIIYNNMNKIQNLLKEKDKSADILSSCLIVEMLTELFLISRHGNDSGKFLPEIIQKAINEIENEFNTPIDLDTLASKLGISKYYLSRQFKKYTGFGPYEYLINYRLNQSKILLKNTDLTVCEIAYRIGFESVSNFIRTFKKQEKVTPYRFRKYWR